MGQRRYRKITVDGVVYEIVPPDGGWGCFVAVATTVIYISTVVPMAGFGFIFQNFLKSLGDETSGAALTNGLFNTVSFFMGLVANILLNRITYRKVAFLGSFLHLTGTIGTVFVTNLTQLTIFLGIFQGMGFGLLLPAALSAFNAYFDKRLQLWISISQTGMVIGYMAMPPLAAWSMEFFGFRGSLLLLVALSIFTLPSALALQPVKQHMRMVRVNSNQEEIELTAISSHNIGNENENNIVPLLKKKEKKSSDELSLKNEEKPSKKTFCCKTMLDSMILLIDPKFLNVCIGLALCFTADIAFYPIIPLILGNRGYSQTNIALMMSVYFGADLIARIGLSVVSAFVSYKSRVLFFWGALLSAIFRTVWLLNNTYWLKMVIMAVLGVLRCFIETLVSLVVSEEYPEKFSSAFSLYMVANGFACLICGPLMSIVKNYTHSDIMVCHVLTVAFLISVVAWSLEMYVFKKKNNS